MRGRTRSGIFLVAWLALAPACAETSGAGTDDAVPGEAEGPAEQGAPGLFTRALSTLTPAMSPDLPPGFYETVVFSGLDRPTTLAFSPDGRVFVAEKSGVIKVFAGLEASSGTVFADLRTEVYNFWDRGLLGLALHPDFPTVPWVYVLYSRDAEIGGVAPLWGTPGAGSDPCPTPPGPTGSGCVASARLSRLVANGNVATGPETVLLENWCQQYPSHSIGTVLFGEDGALYVGGGDGAAFSFVDYGQVGNVCDDPPADPETGLPPLPQSLGGAFRSQNLGPAGYDRVTYDGKILRLDPVSGAALADNPLAGSAIPGQDRIVASGLRNPFRFTTRPGTDELWIGDVGYGAWEEINRLADPTAGVTNFGWPCYEGPDKEGSYRGLGADACEALYAAPAQVTPPVFTYAHVDTVVPGDPCGTGQASVSGLAFHQGGGYPYAYEDALFFSDYSRNCIFVMYPGSDGAPDPATRATFAVGAPGPVDLETGPDGALYYVDFNEGTVRRIGYASGGTPPTADLLASPDSGPAPLTVLLDGSGSTDPDAGDDLLHEWDLDDDGLYDDGTTATFSHTFPTAGAWHVSLRVTDPLGLSDTASATVNVDSSAPTAHIASPNPGVPWKVGDVLSFSGSASDEQDGALPPSALTWTLVLRHCPSACHSHVLQEYPGVASGSFVAPDHDYPSHLELSLRATDSDGLSGTSTIQLLPQTVVLTLQTEPPGLELSVSDLTATTPFTATVIAGSNLSLTAPSPQTLGPATWVYDAWSDGGARTHNAIAPAAPATWTASFAQATPAGGLPAPWTHDDVGATGAAGDASATAGTFTVAGAGADIWGQADSFHFVHQPLTGDGEIRARLVSQAATNPWAKAGVMIRESLTTGSRHALLVVTPSHGAAFQRRPQTNSWSQTTGLAGISAPVWVRLVRVGDVLSGYVSADGAAWTAVGSETVAMSPGVRVGLAVTSHASGTLNTSVFDTVSVSSGGGGPVNLAPSTALTAPSDGAFFSAPANVALTATASDPDGSIARVDFFGDGLLVGSDTTSPYQATWTGVAAGSHTLGAVATDDQGATGATALVTIAVATPSADLPAPWQDADVGVVGAPGGASFDAGTFTVDGSGADIWGQADAFHLAYQPLNGDGEIVARLIDVEATDPWAKAGVMIRESLAAGSRHALLVVTPSHGAAFQVRPQANSWNQASTLSGIAAPTWLRLERTGNVFSAFVSPDGVSWVEVGSEAVPMGSAALVGLAVTSGAVGVVNSSLFDAVSVNGEGGGPPANLAPSATLTAPANGAAHAAPATVTVAATASDPDGTIANVEFFGDGASLGVDASPPYQITWDGVAAGSHTLRAVATDALGATGASALITIVVTAPGVGLPAPWQDADVGAVGAVGSAAHDAGTFTLKGAGADIWSNADAFHFAWQPVAGNATITARVASQQATDSWAKAGVMIRGSSASGSAHAMMVVTPANGAAFQRRQTDGSWTQHTAAGGGGAPRWVRLARVGDTVTASVSPDGLAWTAVGSTTVALPAIALVGLAVTSGANATPGTVTFDHVSF